MAISYRPYEPQQEMLLPASLQDWLPLGHLAYFISDTVDALDLSAFYARYAGGGARNQPFHPAMMVKLLVYGYATGVFSSRKIERRLHEDLAFRMLGAGNFPRHRTIRDFRALHLDELSELFVQVVKLAREMGLVKLGTVAIDGTKIKANASRHKAMSYERMQQAEAELKAQIDALLERARSTDASEPDEPELDIPAEIERREVRLGAIAEARQRLEQRQRDADIERGRSDDDDRRPRDEDGNAKGGRYKREFGVPAAKAQDNFTDPDSRIMKRTGGGFGCQLQRTDGGGQHRAHHRGRAAGQQRGRHATVGANAASGEDQHRRVPPAMSGRCGLPKRGQLRAACRPADRAGGGTGARGQAASANQCAHPCAHGRDGRQAANRRRQDDLPKAQVDCRAPQRLDQERAGVPSVQPERTAPRASRVQARVLGAQSQAHGCHASGVRSAR
jgi:transposase